MICPTWRGRNSRGTEILDKSFDFRHVRLAARLVMRQEKEFMDAFLDAFQFLVLIRVGPELKKILRILATGIQIKEQVHEPLVIQILQCFFDRCLRHVKASVVGLQEYVAGIEVYTP